MIEGGNTRARITDRRVRWWFAGLLLLCIAVRIVMVLIYEPISYGDTGAYLRLGAWVMGNGERGFDGTRVLGYPIFVALFSLDPARIWIGQMGLGVAISVMLFYLGWLTSGQAWQGFLLGALYSLIPGQVLFEANLLTETLTTFLLTLSLVTFLGFTRTSSLRGRIVLVICLGLVASLVGMVRPLFFPLTVVYLGFVWVSTRGTNQRLTQLVGFVLFPLVIQGGWLMYMRNHWGVLSPTTMGGFSMVQHTGGYFEYLPDEHADIRDTYIVFRDAQIAERGVQTNAIWEAIPALSEASGLGFYDLARELNRLSWLLIREHPDLYLRNVLAGWVNFWKAPVYWDVGAIDSSGASLIIDILVVMGRGLSIAVNLSFLLHSFAVILSGKVRSWFRMDMSIWTGIIMVWLFSIIQTFLDHGDNPRFLVPMQMVVFMIVLQAVMGVLKRTRLQRIES